MSSPGNPIYSCCNEHRKAALLGNPEVNGIDYLEVLDHGAIALSSPRQRTLLVHCLNAVPGGLTPANVLIQGGESITGIMALWVAPATPAPAQANAQEAAYFIGLADALNVLVVRTSEAGDFSPYTLRLVNNAAQAGESAFDVTEALAGFDPVLAEVQFSFKVECGPDFDCAPAAPGCPPDGPTPPPINYLAKDYGSFRQVMLDRMNQLVGGWTGGSGGGTEADLAVAMAELVAYAGEALSYQQDAAATEAYLETARSRVSLRRHALLVDYRVHDGCNARAWIHLEVTSQVFLDHTVTRFYTFAPGMPSSLAVGAGNEEAALLAGVVVFEPMQDAVLYAELNRMSFYTWGDGNCCLRKGATEATLRGRFQNLQIGDVLVFEEVLGPKTGNPADADLSHRCAVRLTQVSTQNGMGQPLVDPLFESGTGTSITSASQKPIPVTEIQWSKEDALPFPVCVSSTLMNSSGDVVSLTDVSVALGNVVLADHGLSFTGAPVGAVPQPSLFQPPSDARCATPAPPEPVPVRFRPVLADSPVTQAVPLPLAGSPVTSGIVPLLPTGSVHLTDANGIVCLALKAADPWNWGQYFGVQVVANAVHASNFDLTVIYNPPGGPVGVTGLGLNGEVVLESFPNLSLTKTDSNYVVTQLNTYSRFLKAPSSPTAIPVGFPAGPAKMPVSGNFELKDGGNAPYLTLLVANSLAWPPLFGVLAEGDQQQPGLFNLLVVYSPPSGPVGVQSPVLIEEFDQVSLETVAKTFDADSELIEVRSFAQEPDPGLSAFTLMHYDASLALPEIALTGRLGTGVNTWTPVPDLLESGAADRNFVVEVEYDGTAHLRFGDDVNGQRPESGTVFTADYRIGNGAAGNVGAESLVHFAADPRVANCTNPLPAGGGVDLETNDQIRRRAPVAFLTQERAITMADYEAVAERNSQVQQAVATLRWTGSWYTVFIAAEPASGGNLTPALKKALTQSENRYRLAGQDIQLESPAYLPLEIELTVCVDPSYFPEDVAAGVRQALGCGVQPNGQKGYFYPENFTFGHTVYLSPIYAAVRKVAGVISVTATKFEPQGMADPTYLANGEIPLGPFQIARMDNDPSYPNHGRLTLVVKGGK